MSITYKELGEALSHGHYKSLATKHYENLAAWRNRGLLIGILAFAFLLISLTIFAIPLYQGNLSFIHNVKALFQNHTTEFATTLGVFGGFSFIAFAIALVTQTRRLYLAHKKLSKKQIEACKKKEQARVTELRQKMDALNAQIFHLSAQLKNFKMPKE